jgi:glucose-6-phosphate isomerase
MALKFNFENAKLTEKEVGKYSKSIFEEIDEMKKSLKNEYDSPYASLLLPNDLNDLMDVRKVVEKVKDANAIVVIGIGGSNLGTIAIYEALKGTYHNELEKKKVYFADTVDSFAMDNLIKVLKNEIKNGNKVVLNAISKSGGTTETIANFNVLLKNLKSVQKDIEDYVVITSGENSRFHIYSMEKSMHWLNIQKKVGGRYSVLSNVGLFPLEFLGLDTLELLEGANDMKKKCLSKVMKNPALLGATAIANAEKNNIGIINHFLFGTQLESIGKWERQLMGESLGKEYNKTGRKKVNFGLTPTISIGSTDLHSMAQLYLGGPNNTFHVFVNVWDVPNIELSRDKNLDNVVPHINGRPMSELMDAIYSGVKTAFSNKERPFYEIELDVLNEYNIGALLQMKMIEIMFLGKLFGVNPFDQPNVEEYKIVTKEILKE